MVIKVVERKIFTGTTTPPALRKHFVTRMQTCHLFAVITFLVLTFLYYIIFPEFIDKSFCINKYYPSSLTLKFPSQGC